MPASTDRAGVASVVLLPGAYEVVAGAAVIGRIEVPRGAAVPAAFVVQLPPPGR